MRDATGHFIAEEDRQWLVGELRAFLSLTLPPTIKEIA
jgi:hypothetical protein